MLISISLGAGITGAVDNHISNDEFNLIMEELNKYKAMKEEIRNNSKKKLKEEEEQSLIEKGRQEARESFRMLVEKKQYKGLDLKHRNIIVVVLVLLLMIKIVLKKYDYNHVKKLFCN